MRKYSFPQIEVVQFDTQDIITESGSSSYKLHYGSPDSETNVIGTVKFADIDK